MKILHCITGLSADGAQRMLLRLVEGLIPIGITNIVVNLAHEDLLAHRFRELGVNVVSLGMSDPLSFSRGMSRLRRLIETEKPGLLQGWMYHANCVLSLASVGGRARKIPLFWNIRRGLDDIRERKFSTRGMIRLSRHMSTFPRKIIYCTAQSRNQHEAYGFRANRGVVVGNGFDTEVLRPGVRDRADILRGLGIPEDALVIGHVGRWDLAKGHPFLIEAFAQVVQSYPHAHLMLVGRGVDQDNSELSTLLRTHSLSNKVHLLGERDDVRDLYSGMDVFCSSSLAEGFPNVIAEAMSCGVPCVVTDTGASRDLVFGVGYVVPPRSSRHLAHGLSEMLAASPEHRRTMGSDARYRIAEKHSLEAIVSQYAGLYRMC